MYVSRESPREFSGTHARRNEEALRDLDLEEEEVVGRSEASGAGVLCCISAMKPGILSFEEGVGCT